MRLTQCAASYWHQSIQLIQEYNGWCHLPRLSENLFHSLLAFAIPLGEKCAPFDGYEVGLALICHGLGEHGLSGTGWAVEQDSFGCIDPQASEAFCIS